MLSGPLDAHDAALSSNAFGTTPKKELGKTPAYAPAASLSGRLAVAWQTHTAKS